MITTIYVIRHGQTDGNKLRVFQGQIDTPLNETGREQVLETCKNLVKLGINFDVLISSPLSRAVETASIIKSFFPSKKEIIIEPDATERSFGDAEGIPLSQENYDKIMNGEFNNLETEFQIMRRARHLIDRILEKYPGKIIIIVTHSHFLKACFKPYIQNLRFDSKTKNAGISMLKFNEFKHCIKAQIDINS